MRSSGAGQGHGRGRASGRSHGKGKSARRSKSRTGASGKRKTRKPRRRQSPPPGWIPPSNARSIQHEPGSREDLLQQMRILQWRKAEVDARMKSVMQSTKEMAEQDLMVGLAVDRTAERAMWMQAVIGEELSRPLYFDKAAMLDLERHAARESEAQRKQARTHNKLLQTVQTGVLRRDPSLVKAGLVSTLTSSSKVSLPEITAQANLGPESLKQLEELDAIKGRLKKSHKHLKSKATIITEVTTGANTFSNKRSSPSRSGAASPAKPGSPAELRIGASALSP